MVSCELQPLYSTYVVAFAAAVVHSPAVRKYQRKLKTEVCMGLGAKVNNWKEKHKLVSEQQRWFETTSQMWAKFTKQTQI